MRSAFLFTVTLLLLLSHTGCQADDPPKQAPASKADSPASLELSEQAIRNSRLETLQAGPHSLNQVRDFPGKIALDEHRVQAVSSKVGGVAQLTDKHVGQRVSRGELLAVIESRELADLRLEYLRCNQTLEQAQKRLQREENLTRRIQQLIRALRQGGQPEQIHTQVQALQIGSSKSRLLTDYSRLKLAQQRYARETGLAQEQLATTQEQEQARQELETARAEYTGSLEDIIWQRENTLLEQRQQVTLAQSTQTAARAKLLTFGPGGLKHLTPEQMTHFEIYSPLTGVVVSKQITEGQGVQPDTPLYTVADLSEVWAELQVYESELDHIRLGQRVRVRAEGLSQTAPGQITHFKPLVDELSRAAEAHAHIANPDLRWRPGMYVTVQVTENVFSVPVAIHKEAVQQLNGKTTVFVRQGQRFIARPVQIGREDSQWAEIRAGLRAGETYAARNSFILKSALLTAQEE